MSLNQFLAEYGVEQQCEAVLEGARWRRVPVSKVQQ